MTRIYDTIKKNYYIIKKNFGHSTINKQNKYIQTIKKNIKNTHKQNFVW